MAHALESDFYPVAFGFYKHNFFELYSDLFSMDTNIKIVVESLNYQCCNKLFAIAASLPGSLVFSFRHLARYTKHFRSLRAIGCVAVFQPISKATSSSELSSQSYKVD